MKQLIGKRKFIICNFAIMIFAVLIKILANTDANFSLGAIEIGAVAGGLIGIIGVVIYGYKQEYKKDEIK